MVYKIVWTLKALDSYVANMQYLEKAWTNKGIRNFAVTVEKKLLVLSKQPGIGSPKDETIGGDFKMKVN